mmetsp:Transcript_36860/g.91766  ORF Transcript_36860/g.91766 Transcript_36860/m.91766 type:complete len:2107 (+) Transcript_36860:60-6380(+)|eukprot:CAMPEP_0179905228 /NCGR_PEP_ID=MMETSP0982-20121206/42469_1 /TAXON_ID=483367 /ORGANISM="non described non described, Strain CCMP 2436" /LENGTH=2106 /DNA_ID=CAMNT_0021805395 /DNA_START=10 /DNA_END=6330 /DNA_ORIENTATION=+
MTPQERAIASVLQTLEGELRAVSVDARNVRDPASKEAAERALVALRASADIAGEDEAAQLSAMLGRQELVQQLMLVFGSKHAAFVSTALLCVYRLCAVASFEAGAIARVVNALAERACGKETSEQLQLKLLQTALHVASAPGAPVDETHACQLLRVCTALHASKSAVVRSTARATVQQLVAVILERADAEVEPWLSALGGPPPTPGPRTRAAVAVLSACCYAHGWSGAATPAADDSGSARLMRTELSGLPYGLCLETLTAALQQHHSLLTRVPAFKRSAEEIAALAAAALSDPAGRRAPWGAQLRMVQLAATLLVTYSRELPVQCRELLTAAVGLLEDEAMAADDDEAVGLARLRCLAAEAVGSVVQQPRLVLWYLCDAESVQASPLAGTEANAVPDFMVRAVNALSRAASSGFKKARARVPGAQGLLTALEAVEAAVVRQVSTAQTQLHARSALPVVPINVPVNVPTTKVTPEDASDHTKASDSTGVSEGVSNHAGAPTSDSENTASVSDSTGASDAKGTPDPKDMSDLAEAATSGESSLSATPEDLAAGAAAAAAVDSIDARAQIRSWLAALALTSSTNAPPWPGAVCGAVFSLSESDGSNFGTRADVLARTAAGVLLACQALAHLHAELIAEQSEATVAEAACELLRAVLTECAQPLLDALELMLASVASEEALTMALKSLGSLCVMCLAVGLTDARDDCLVALEAVCMPPPPRSMHARDGSNEVPAPVVAPPAEFSASGIASSAINLLSPTRGNGGNMQTATSAPIPSGGSGSESGGHTAPHALLAVKHVLALKQLFAIVHALGATLGVDQWTHVLKTCAQLDALVAVALGDVGSDIPSASANADTSASGAGSVTGVVVAAGGGLIGAHSLRQELTILAAALHSVFASSALLPDQALVAMMGALATQALQALAHEATARPRAPPPGSRIATPARAFALKSLVLAADANVSRWQLTWPLVIQHLLPAANHSVPHLRTLGVDSMMRLVLSILRHMATHTSESEKLSGAPRLPKRKIAERDEEAPSYEEAPSLGAPDVPSTAQLAGGASGTAWQLQLLSPLDELHRQCGHRDTRDKLLQALYSLLLFSGADLHAGWHAVLRMLDRVATGGSEHAALVPLAFKSVQVVASDFLHALSARALRKFIAVAGAFALQHEQLNVALTAVGLQWSCADYLATDPFEEDATDYSNGLPVRPFALRDGVGGIEEASRSFAEAGGHAAPPTADELWVCVLTELQALCEDAARPELRTCAYHTLEEVLMAHGHRLSHDAWDATLWRVLLPLCASVSRAAELASPDAISAPELGRVGGQPVLLQLHHSRDTARKQWDEARVLALRAVTRVVRTHLTLLKGRPRFAQAWAHLLRFVEASALSAPGSAEVGDAAVGALLQLLLLPKKGSGPIAVAAPAAAAAPATAEDNDEGVTDAAPAATPVAEPVDSSAAIGNTAPTGPSLLPFELRDGVWAVCERVAESATGGDGLHFTLHARLLLALVDQLAAGLYDAVPAGELTNDESVRLVNIAEHLLIPAGGLAPLGPGGARGWAATVTLRASPADLLPTAAEAIARAAGKASGKPNDPTLLQLAMLRLLVTLAHTPDLQSQSEGAVMRRVVSVLAAAAAPPAELSQLSLSPNARGLNSLCAVMGRAIELACEPHVMVAPAASWAAGTGGGIEERCLCMATQLILDGPAAVRAQLDKSAPPGSLAKIAAAASALVHSAEAAVYFSSARVVLSCAPIVLAECARILHSPPALAAAAAASAAAGLGTAVVSSTDTGASATLALPLACVHASARLGAALAKLYAPAGAEGLSSSYIGFEDEAVGTRVLADALSSALLPDLAVSLATLVAGAGFLDGPASGGEAVRKLVGRLQSVQAGLVGELGPPLLYCRRNEAGVHEQSTSLETPRRALLALLEALVGERTKAWAIADYTAAGHTARDDGVVKEGSDAEADVTTVDGDAAASFELPLRAAAILHGASAASAHALGVGSSASLLMRATTKLLHYCAQTGAGANNIYADGAEAEAGLAAESVLVEDEAVRRAVWLLRALTNGLADASPLPAGQLALLMPVMVECLGTGGRGRRLELDGALRAALQIAAAELLQHSELSARYSSGV